MRMGGGGMRDGGTKGVVEWVRRGNGFGGEGGCHEIVSNKSRRGGEAWERVVGEVVEE